ncbi:MAG: hypothetical protein ACOZCO_10050 [Bacteroidota bacterium]
MLSIKSLIISTGILVILIFSCKPGEITGAGALSHSEFEQCISEAENMDQLIQKTCSEIILPEWKYDTIRLGSAYWCGSIPECEQKRRVSIQFSDSSIQNYFSELAEGVTLITDEIFFSMLKESEEKGKKDTTFLQRHFTLSADLELINSKMACAYYSLYKFGENDTLLENALLFILKDGEWHPAGKSWKGKEMEY